VPKAHTEANAIAKRVRLRFIMADISDLNCNSYCQRSRMLSDDDFRSRCSCRCQGARVIRRVDLLFLSVSACQVADSRCLERSGKISGAYVLEESRFQNLNFKSGLKTNSNSLLTNRETLK
jgi:hypothetical protein